MNRTTPGHSSRAAWGSISREQIVAAALKEVRAGRYDDMSIRRLANVMGVAPMSLYRHFRNREDLLDEIVDQLLAGSWRPLATNENWRTWVIETTDLLRRLLVDQPVVLEVYLAHPVVSPAAVERMDAMLAVLTKATKDDARARRVYFALHTYTLGFATLEAARGGWVPPDGTSALSLELGAMTTAEQFCDVLGALLDGLLQVVPLQTEMDQS